MRTSLRGICSMLAEEAIVLSSYDDGTGTETIGAGHTAAAGQPFPRPGMKITLTEAINIFRSDLEKYEREVTRAVRAALSQHQFDALVSWHFNTGAISSATLTERLNAGDMGGAATEFSRWNKSKGKVLDGLISRRQRETALFQEGEYGDPTIRVIDSKGGREEHFKSAQIETLLGGAISSEEEQSTEELLANPASRLLPFNRPKQSAALSRALLSKFIDLIPTERRADAVAIVAVRGYYLNSMGTERTNDRGVYDDAIFVLEPGNVYNFNGNTDPGKFARGIARLKSRQAVRYRPGPHGFSRKSGPYPAFRQDSNCTVIRDEIGEDTDSADKRFWINLHRGGNTTTSSLGCQTVPPHQWNEFKTLVDGLLKKHGQETFFYILVDEEDVPKEEAIVIKTQEQSATTVAGPVQTEEAIRLAKSLEGRTTIRPEELVALQDTLKALDAQRKAINDVILGAATLDPLASARDPELTPVNGALGKTVGHALDGRKTAIGVIGMLVTTILPVFFPQLAPVVSVAGPLVDAATNAVTTTSTAVQQASIPRDLLSAAFPVFAAITGWGTMGKVEKWVRALRSSLDGR